MSEDTTTESTEPVADEAPASVVEEESEEVTAEPVEEERAPGESAITMDYLVNGFPEPPTPPGNSSPVDLPVAKADMIDAIGKGGVDDWLYEVRLAVEVRQRELQLDTRLKCVICTLPFSGDPHKHQMTAQDNSSWTLTLNASKDKAEDGLA